MSSDHEDAPLEAYQYLRAAAEKDVKERVFYWAMNEAPDALTIAQIRKIKDDMVHAVNHHTRQVFELRRASKK